MTSTPQTHTCALAEPAGPCDLVHDVQSDGAELSFALNASLHGHSVEVGIVCLILSNCIAG